MYASFLTIVASIKFLGFEGVLLACFGFGSSTEGAMLYPGFPVT